MNSNCPRGKSYTLRNRWGSNISLGKNGITVVICHLGRTPPIWEEGIQRVPMFVPLYLVGNAFFPQGATEYTGIGDQCGPWARRSSSSTTPPFPPRRGYVDTI